MPMMPTQLETSTAKNVRLVPVEPEVKSAKTREKSLRGVRAKAETPKSADPIVYNVSVTQTSDPAVGAAGLFENRRRMEMERVVAIKKLGKMLGKSLGYRVDPTAPRADERDQAREEAKTLNAAFNAAAEAEAERQKAILGADAEYQRLKAETKRLREAKDRAWSKSHHYKFTVGTSNGMFFHVRAQGDSWEEVINKLNTKAA